MQRIPDEHIKDLEPALLQGIGIENDEAMGVPLDDALLCQGQ